MKKDLEFGLVLGGIEEIEFTEKEKKKIRSKNNVFDKITIIRGLAQKRNKGDTK